MRLITRMKKTIYRLRIERNAYHAAYQVLQRSMLSHKQDVHRAQRILKLILKRLDNEESNNNTVE